MEILESSKESMAALNNSKTTDWAVAGIVLLCSILVLYNCHPLLGAMLLGCGIVLLVLAIYKAFIL